MGRDSLEGKSIDRIRPVRPGCHYVGSVAQGAIRRKCRERGLLSDLATYSEAKFQKPNAIWVPSHHRGRAPH